MICVPQFVFKFESLLVCHEAVQEMRVGPSESAYRSRLQTTSSCKGKEPLW
jgi:hypothetical protein